MYKQRWSERSDNEAKATKSTSGERYVINHSVDRWNNRNQCGTKEERRYHFSGESIDKWCKIRHFLVVLRNILTRFSNILFSRRRCNRYSSFLCSFNNVSKSMEVSNKKELIPRDKMSAGTLSEPLICRISDVYCSMEFIWQISHGEDWFEKKTAKVCGLIEHEIVDLPEVNKSIALKKMWQAILFQVFLSRTVFWRKKKKEINFHWKSHFCCKLATVPMAEASTARNNSYLAWMCNNFTASAKSDFTLVKVKLARFSSVML